MQYFAAITTKYIGPSNVLGSRIKATCQAGSVTIPYPHGLSVQEGHAKAAEALARKWGWSGVYVMGGMPNGNGFCFVSISISRDGMMPRVQADHVAFTIGHEEADETQRRNIAKLPKVVG